MSFRKIYPLIFILLLSAVLLISASCGTAKSYDIPAAGPADGFGDDAASFGGMEAERQILVADVPPSAGPRVGESAVRYRIRTGSLDLTVESTLTTVDSIKEIVAAAGGVVSNLYVYKVGEERCNADMTLRVPENRFDAVMQQLKELGKYDHDRENEKDVTMEYLDLEARLENLKAQEERYREILEKATNVEEILKVERELNRIRSDIESLTAQFEYLRDQVQFSTITVSIQEEQIATTAVSSSPFDRLGGRMKEALIRSVNFILNMLAGLLVVLAALLPVLLILALLAAIVWLIVRAAVRRRPPSTGQGSSISKDG